MAHSQQIEFVEVARSLFPEMFTGRKVLEIGSLDVNGTIRNLFNQCDYTGLDIASGAGVDVVCEGQKYDAPSASFDVVISCEVMEHNPYWKETLENMIRLLSPGGLMIMSCATIGRPEHGTSRCHSWTSPFTVEQGWGYYRNLTKKDISGSVDLAPFFACGFASNWDSWDLYFLGVKAGGDPSATRRITRFRAIYRRQVIPAWFGRIRRGLQNPARIKGFFARIFPAFITRRIGKH
jgi:SAM-dependent methyltransferase